jgi:hypothetical protein
MSPSATCPFCKAAYEIGCTACPTCQTTFPWTADIERLKDEIKSREPSRVRASLALAEEVVETIRTGKPVSSGAIKGLITAWLLPRTVIVMGYLIGATILALQTWILWNQTQFLATQTRAAQIEQAAKLRERLGLTVNYKHRLDNIAHSLMSRVWETDCAVEYNKIDIITLIRALTPGTPKTLSLEEYLGWNEFARKIAFIAGSVGSNASSPPNRTIVGVRQLVNDVLQPIRIHCRFEFDKTVYLLEDMEFFESTRSKVAEIDLLVESSRRSSQQIKNLESAR